jgi:hypothetical protein
LQIRRILAIFTSFSCTKPKQKIADERIAEYGVPIRHSLAGFIFGLPPVIKPGMEIAEKCIEENPSQISNLLFPANNYQTEPGNCLHKRIAENPKQIGKRHLCLPIYYQTKPVLVPKFLRSRPESLAAALRFHDILVRIRIRGSLSLTNGSRSGSCYFRH